MEHIGAKLAKARISKGLSLDQVARQTRIAEEHLAAIEAGLDDTLPAGPYRRAWIRIYCEAMGVEEPEHLPDAAPPPPVVPLNVVRAVGLLAIVSLVGIVAFIQWGRQHPADTAPPPPVVPDQIVGISAVRTIQLVVEVDGEVRFDGKLPGGETRVYEGHDEVALRVPAVDAVRVTYNGDSVVPQGRQDAPRTLVFVDDGGR